VGRLETIKLSGTPKKALVAVFSSIFLVVLFVAVGLRTTVMKEPVSRVLSEQSVEQDVSEVTNQTAQVASLKKEILELQAMLVQKESENAHLKKEVCDFQGALNRVLADLKAIQANEQIQLVVERLRTEPPTSALIP
jgi:peptidoglycan hydrolase CwlO-like protein